MKKIEINTEIGSNYLDDKEFSGKIIESSNTARNQQNIKRMRINNKILNEASSLNNSNNNYNNNINNNNF